MPDFTELSAQVQRNCHVSDAKYARSYSLCTYLLKMREYFRWEKGYALHDVLPREDVGGWVDAREQFWETLASADFQCLPLADNCYDPFDSESVNREILPHGLLYSGGYGRFGQPHFFLARLLRVECHAGLNVYVAADEYARDLASPPAMAQERSIYIRRDSLRRTVWQMVDEWRWKRSPGPMAEVLNHYDFETDPEGAVERMTADEVASVVLHEVGEVKAGDLLGSTWNDMLMELAGGRAELVARAVRDHLADALSTLPALIAQGEASPIHFYFANLKATRRELVPDLVRAYEHWCEQGDLGVLQDRVSESSERWLSSAKRMLAAYEQEVDPLEAVIEDAASGRCPRS